MEKYCRYCQKYRNEFTGKRCDTCKENMLDPKELRNRKKANVRKLYNHIEFILDKRG